MSRRPQNSSIPSTSKLQVPYMHLGIDLFPWPPGVLDFGIWEGDSGPFIRPVSGMFWLRLWTRPCRDFRVSEAPFSDMSA